MKQTFTNSKNIPEAIAIWLAHDEYDSVDLENYISATSIIKPLRQIVLSDRVENTSVELASMVNSRMGTAIHDACEKAWYNPEAVSAGLKACGYPDKIINSIKINPTTVNDEDIPVYLEQRITKEIDGYVIGGKFDLVMNGDLFDYKSTSVWSYLDQTNSKKYIEQGSIYRYLNPEIITGDFLTIVYIFTDWNFQNSKQRKDYPSERVVAVQYPLLSLSETEHLIKSKVAQIKKYKNLNQAELPECTNEDLWVKPSIFKYYKNPQNKTRSTKNFSNYADAQQFMNIKHNGVGEIVEVKGKAVRCNYCPARTICTQATQLEKQGML